MQKASEEDLCKCVFWWGKEATSYKQEGQGVVRT